MDIYFVRHGQTDGNVAKRHQHPDISLNELGKQQATAIATAISAIEPTHLITSTNKRAVETAREISLVTDLIPETHQAFEELHRPQWLLGRRLLERDTLLYVIGWFLGRKESVRHDGESYQDFRRRIVDARTHLESLPTDSRVVVVSHAIFINFFLEHMNNDGRMRISSAVKRFIKIFHLKNTSVTHLRYDGAKWHLVR